MANTLAAFGLRHYAGSVGSNPTFERVKRKIASNNSTKIFQGDLVENLSTGYIAQWVNGHNVNIAAGVFDGCEYLSVSQGRRVFSNFWPGSDASGDVDAWIIPIQGQQQRFVIQSTGASAVALTNVGNNADITVGTGSTVTGLSGMALAQSTINTTATFPLRIEDVYQGLGNGADTTSGNNWVVVSINWAGQTGV